MACADGKLNNLRALVLRVDAEHVLFFAKANGETVDPRTLPRLDISVSSKVSSEPVDAERPVIEDYGKIIADIKENASKEAEHIQQTTQ